MRSERVLWSLQDGGARREAGVFQACTSALILVNTFFFLFFQISQNLLVNFPTGSVIELKLLLRSWDLLCLWLWKHSASDDVYSEIFLFLIDKISSSMGRGPFHTYWGNSSGIMSLFFFLFIFSWFCILDSNPKLFGDWEGVWVVGFQSEPEGWTSMVNNKYISSVYLQKTCDKVKTLNLIFPCPKDFREEMDVFVKSWAQQVCGLN